MRDLLQALEDSQFLESIFPNSQPKDPSRVTKLQREFAGTVIDQLLKKGATHKRLINLPQGFRRLLGKQIRDLEQLVESYPDDLNGHILRLSAAAVGGWRKAQFVRAMDDLSSRPHELQVFLDTISQCLMLEPKRDLNDDEIEAIVVAFKKLFGRERPGSEHPQLPVEARAKFLTTVGALFNVTRNKHYNGLVDDFGETAKATLNELGGKQLVIGINVFPWAFALQWAFMKNYADVQRRIHDTVIEPFVQLTRRYAVDNVKPRRTGGTAQKAAIGYLVQHAVTAGAYANGRAVVSLLKGHHLLQSGKFDIYVYVFGNADQSVIAEIESFGFQTRLIPYKESAYSKIEKLRALFEADNISVLITESYAWLSTALYATRAAPVQMYLSCGFIKWQFDEVDRYLMFSNLMDGRQKWELPEEKIIEVNYPLDERYLDRSFTDDEIASVRAAYPSGCTLLGTLCRMEKVSPEFLEAVAAILDRCPNTIYLVHGPFSRAQVDQFAASRNLSKRLIAKPETDPHLIGHVLDLFLDTFPLCGGMACIEAQAKGLPVVHLKSDALESMAVQRDPELTVQTAGEYVDLVCNLVSDAERLARARARAKDVVKRVTDLRLSAQQIESASEEALAR